MSRVLSSKQSMKSREIHFEKGPIVGALLSYTAPILLSQLLQQVYNITDCVIVGRFCGSYGLAAAGLGGLILSVLINFFIGFSTGAGILVSQQFGAYRYEKLRKTISTIVHLGMLLGLLLTGAGLVSSCLLLKMISCPEDMFSVSNTYLMICFLGLLPQLVYNIGNAILEALGDTKSPLHYLFFSCLINLGLDALFVIGFDFGLAGAAAATVIAQWILFLMMMGRLYMLDPAYAYRMNSEMLSLKELGEMIALSLPSGMQAVFMSISSLVLQVTINSFGAAAVAGMTVYAKLEGFLYYPAFSYGIALTGFVGQNYGARCMDRVKQSVRVSLGVCTAIILPLSLFLVAISHHALGIFTTDADVIYNGCQAILYNFPFYFLYMINQIYLGSLKGLGKTTYPMICTMVCYFFFRVFWCWLWIPHFHSMIVVYTSYDASWIVMILMLIPYFRKTLKEKSA